MNSARIPDASTQRASTAKKPRNASTTADLPATGSATVHATASKKPNPDDACARCEHKRKDHNPPTTYQAMNSTRSMTAKGTPVLALTCCWSNPLCSCVKFIEPGGNPKGTYQVDGYWF